MRKLLFTFLIVFSVFKMNAQYVTIPDTNFVNWLNNNGYSGCMNGNLMDTTCNIVITTQQVNCQNAQIADLTGIQYFDNLISLNCAFNQLTTILFPLSLIDLDFDNNFVSELPNLPSGIHSIDCHNNLLVSLPDLPNTLEIIICFNNLIDSIPVLPSSLKWLDCHNNQLVFLSDITDSILYLDCSMNYLTELKYYYSGAELYCQGNQLTSLPQIKNGITKLNISDNPGLKCLPPISNIGFFTWNNTGINCFPTTLSVTTSTPPVNSIPICEFYNSYGCGVSWNINGSVFFDFNLDCYPNSTERRLRNLKLNLYENGTLLQQTFTNDFGQYVFQTDTGTYQFALDTSYISMFNVLCPSNGNYASIITILDSIDYNMNFAIGCPLGFDIGVNNIVHSNGQFRPTNLATVKIHTGDLSHQYNLNCASGISGTVSILINGPATYINATSGSLIPIVSGDTLLYIIADFGTVNFQNDFGIIVQADTSAQIGQQICFDVTVTPTAGDNNPTNNFYTHCFNVVNSYDPNDKQVSPIGIIDTTQEWLTYTIRFQNTGNAPAQHIYILDTLDTNIDESSIQLLAYSHEPLVQVVGNIVRFNFPNINLPDSINDEPNSHGFVQYKVKTKPGLQDGTDIENTAYIYFDFNAPVVTNTTVNTIDIVNGIQQQTGGGAIQVYPNPFSTTITMESSEPIISVQLFDITGRMVYHANNKGSKVSSDLNFLPYGLYVLEISTAASTERKKIVKR